VIDFRSLQRTLSDAVSGAVSSDMEENVWTLTYPGSKQLILTAHPSEVIIGGDFLPNLSDTSISESDFLSSIDVLSAMILMRLDGIPRLPSGFGYPHDFLSKDSPDV